MNNNISGDNGIDTIYIILVYTDKTHTRPTKTLHDPYGKKQFGLESVWNRFGKVTEVIKMNSNHEYLANGKIYLCCYFFSYDI